MGVLGEWSVGNRAACIDFGRIQWLAYCRLTCVEHWAFAVHFPYRNHGFPPVFLILDIHTHTHIYIYLLLLLYIIIYLYSILPQGYHWVVGSWHESTIAILDLLNSWSPTILYQYTPRKHLPSDNVPNMGIRQYNWSSTMKPRIWMKNRQYTDVYGSFHPVTSTNHSASSSQLSHL